MQGKPRSPRVAVPESWSWMGGRKVSTARCASPWYYSTASKQQLWPSQQQVPALDATHAGAALRPAVRARSEPPQRAGEARRSSAQEEGPPQTASPQPPTPCHPQRRPPPSHHSPDRSSVLHYTVSPWPGVGVSRSCRQRAATAPSSHRPRGPLPAARGVSGCPVVHSGGWMCLPPEESSLTPKKRLVRRRRGVHNTCVLHTTHHPLRVLRPPSGSPRCRPSRRAEIARDPSGTGWERP